MNKNAQTESETIPPEPQPTEKSRRPVIMFAILGAAILAPTMAMAFFLLSPTQPEVRSTPDEALAITDVAEAERSTANPKEAATASSKVRNLPSLQELAPMSHPPDTQADGQETPMSLPEQFPPPLESRATLPNSLPLDEGMSGFSNAPAEIDFDGAELKSKRPTQLRREGTEVHGLIGHISKRGASLVFVPDDHSPSLALLEGQLLERVEYYEQVNARHARSASWQVSGRVTEYRGTNYLLITSATLLDEPKPPQPMNP